MHRETVRRGAVALAFAVALVLAGARPAAAEEPRLFQRSLGWLAGFWNEVVEENVYELGGLLGLWEAASAEADQGFGIDPNGSSSEPVAPSSENR